MTNLIMNYKTKYLKYVEKNNALNNIILNTNQVGGKKDEEYYKKKLLKIKEKTKKKGYVYIFDEDGKLISRGLNISEAEAPILKKIKKNPIEWNNKILCYILIKFIPDDVMNSESGGLDLSIDVNKIIVVNSHVSIPIRDDKSSLIRLFYKYDELDFFQLNDLKKIALVAINRNLGKIINPFEFYHYKDIEKKLKKYE